jgi:hypothetical protein
MSIVEDLFAIHLKLNKFGQFNFFVIPLNIKRFYGFRRVVPRTIGSARKNRGKGQNELTNKCVTNFFKRQFSDESLP